MSLYSQGLTLLKVWIMACFLQNFTDACYSPESCLYSSLFQDYDSHVRPAEHPGDRITVTTTLYARSLSGIDEKNEIMSLVGYLELEWYDRFLLWDPAEHNETSYLILYAEDIWLPDTVILNSVGDYYKSTYKEDFRVIIGYNGYVSWSFGGTFQTSCSLDISEYPFDTQECSIKVENFVYPKALVDLRLSNPEVIKQDFEENTLWKLKEIKAKRKSFGEGGIDYPRITFTFSWQRKTLYYAFNIIIPTIFISLITLGVFWLPPACGEKISLGITVLLAFSVFQIIIMDNTPVNSDVTPRISKVVIFVMSMATISLLGSMLTVFIDGKSDANRAPKWLRIVAFKVLARVFFLRDEIPEIAEENHIKPTVEDLTTENGLSNEIKKAVSANEMAQILAHLEFLTNHVKAKERSNSITDEWKLLAKILDRLLFWCCLVIFVIYFISTLAYVVSRD